MTMDPEAAFSEAVKAIEQRIHSIKRDLEVLRGSSEAVNAEAEISLALEDIEAGWNDARRVAHVVAETNPLLAHGFLAAHLQCLDGWLDAGRLLSRSEVVSRRFGPKAHAAARAAKALKNAPIKQIEADIIAEEMANISADPSVSSPYTVADAIEGAVNKRLQKTVIDGRQMKALSVTTIARRIISFTL